MKTSRNPPTGSDRAKPKPGNPLSFARLAFLAHRVKAALRGGIGAKATDPARPAPPPIRRGDEPSTPPLPRIPSKPDDELLDGKVSAIADARRRERERCAAIMTSPAAMVRPAAARKFAFETRVSRGEALTLLQAMPAPVACASTNAELSAARAARNPRLSASAPEGLSRRPSSAHGWDRAFAAARGVAPHAPAFGSGTALSISSTATRFAVKASP